MMATKVIQMGFDGNNFPFFMCPNRFLLLPTTEEDCYHKWQQSNNIKKHKSIDDFYFYVHY